MNADFRAHTPSTEVVGRLWFREGGTGHGEQDELRGRGARLYPVLTASLISSFYTSPFRAGDVCNAEIRSLHFMPQKLVFLSRGTDRLTEVVAQTECPQNRTSNFILPSSFSLPHVSKKMGASLPSQVRAT